MYQDGRDEIQASSASKGETSIVTEIGARMISSCTYRELRNSSHWNPPPTCNVAEVSRLQWQTSRVWTGPVCTLLQRKWSYDKLEPFFVSMADNDSDHLGSSSRGPWVFPKVPSYRDPQDVYCIEVPMQIPGWNSLLGRPPSCQGIGGYLEAFNDDWKLWGRRNRSLSRSRSPSHFPRWSTHQTWSRTTEVDLSSHRWIQVDWREEHPITDFSTAYIPGILQLIRYHQHYIDAVRHRLAWIILLSM